MEGARTLVPVHGAELGVPDREIPVAVQLALVQEDVPGQFIGLRTNSAPLRG